MLHKADMMYAPIENYLFCASAEVLPTCFSIYYWSDQLSSHLYVPYENSPPSSSSFLCSLPLWCKISKLSRVIQLLISDNICSATFFSLHQHSLLSKDGIEESRDGLKGIASTSRGRRGFGKIFLEAIVNTVLCFQGIVTGRHTSSISIFKYQLVPFTDETREERGVTREERRERRDERRETRDERGERRGKDHRVDRYWNH